MFDNVLIDRRSMVSIFASLGLKKQSDCDSLLLV